MADLKLWGFAICHLTSAIQDAFFSILLTHLDRAALRATGTLSRRAASGVSL